jgi:UDP-2,3-diacylglucosamine pyrophosphatase LpxH
MAMRAVVIGDLHLPFHNKKKLDECLYFIKQTQPEHVIQIGDALDMLLFSSHDRKFQGIYPSGAQEIAEGAEELRLLWKMVKKFSPKSKCFQLIGNHEDRVHKRIMEKLPEIRHVYDPKGLWTIEGVKTIYDPRESLVIEGIHFIHGYRTKLGDHCKYILRSVVCGHSHRGGVFYHPLHDGKMIYELNVGHLLDIESVATNYMPQRYINWTHGFGVIDEHGPRFIPL